MERGRVATLYLGHGEGLHSAQTLGVCDKKGACPSKDDTRMLVMLVYVSDDGETAFES